MNPISVKIDDRDPRVRFNGNWRIGGVKQDFNKTESSSTRVGDSFVVPFYGQSIVVYGSIDATSEGVVTNYSINGMPPVQLTSQRSAGDLGKQQFWASPALNVSQHELTVTMVKVNDVPKDGEGTIWFDYFTVYDPSGHERMPPPSNKALPKGAIVGAVMGSVICLTLLFSGAFFWIRKRRLRLKDETRPHHYYLERAKDLRDHPQEKHDGMGSLGALEARSRLSRIGIQPFTFEPSVPLGLPQVTPAFTKSRVLEEAGSKRDRDNNSQSQLSSSRLPQNIVAGTTTRSNAQDPPISSVKLRLTHRSISPSGADSLHPTDALASPSRDTADETVVDFGATSSNPTSAADTNHGGSSDQTSINCAQSSSALTSDPSTFIDVERTTSSPGVEVTLGHSTDSAVRPEQTDSEGELRSRSTIQHVDSGIRLGIEALGPPIELPPVYSAI